jgi:AraC-like DNA-binding protein
MLRGHGTRLELLSEAALLFISERSGCCEYNGVLFMETLKAFYLQYLFFGQFFMFVFAASQFISREKLKINYIYSISYIFMGLAIIQIVSYSTKVFPDYIYMSYFLIPATTGSPLLLFLRYRFLIEGRMIKWPIPFTVFLLSILLFLMAGPLLENSITFSKEYAELRPILHQSFAGLPLYFKIVHYLNFLSKITLSLATLILLIKTMYLWKRNDSGKIMIARLVYICVVLMFLTSLLLVIGDLFSFEFSKAGVFMINTATLGVFFTSQYDADYYGIFKHVKKKKKYAVSKVSGIDVEAIISKLHGIMIEQELYKEENITLKAVAEKMNVNFQQLSEILNKDIKKNFNTYINEFKVEEAKRLLVQEPDLPVIRVAFMVGFNSLRTFNRAFGKNTGYTPIDYRKNFLITKK